MEKGKKDELEDLEEKTRTRLSKSVSLKSVVQQSALCSLFKQKILLICFLGRAVVSTVTLQQEGSVF